MYHSRSISAVSFIAATFMAGCMVSTEPDSTIDSAEQAIIDESGAMPVPAQSEIHLERTAEGESLSLAPDATWKEIAPGVFERGAEKGAGRIVIGAQGHQWAIAQAEKDLAGLYERAALDADGNPAIVDVIRQHEVQIESLKQTAESIAAAQGNTPQALSCNIAFYTGPSSPISGYYGAAALAQVSCYGGCQVFTVSSQVCTNYGCTGVYSSSRYVCSTPWTYGVAMSGTYGASCSSWASVSPPGVSSSWAGFCG